MASLDDKCQCGHSRIEHREFLESLGCVHKGCACTKFETIEQVVADIAMYSEAVKKLGEGS